ncbi:MAG TPA: SGNH/GDSL hydrolase family protein [Candidatus Cybelea sp.]
MELLRVKKPLSILALFAIAACGGGGGGGSMPVTNPAQPSQQSILTRIVGVGDSLTAGYQADGFLGATGVNNPLYPSGPPIPPSQESGWWALLYEQASSDSLGNAIATVYNATKSPLPLIAGPGLDNQIVQAPPSSSAPIAQFKGANPCNYDHSFNQAGFGLRASARVRVNSNAAAIRNFGIPGLTLHEAITIHQPQTETCSPLPGIPGLLSDVVNEESGTFWPVLRNFAKLQHFTEVNAAASVHPTLATVWLGANDVLKYMGSGGRFVGGDRNASQAEGDLRSTISALKGAGAKVVVANLPTILETGYFQNVTIPKDPEHDCQVQSYAYCLTLLAGFPPSFIKTIAKQYGLETPGGCVPTSLDKPCGYLTLPAVLLILQYYNIYYGQFPNLDCAKPAPHCKPVKGSGLGANYITPSFAAKIESLNEAINQGIDNAASATSVPLVDVSTIFKGLASGDPHNRYYRLAASINPGVCCTLGYRYPTASYSLPPGGILSFDGIHPSNSGYALIAYVFINTINKAYGTNIPQVDLAAAYNGTRCSNSKYCFPDPYAAH